MEDELRARRARRKEGLTDRSNESKSKSEKQSPRVLPFFLHYGLRS